LLVGPGGGFADHADHLGQHVLDVAHDGDVDLDALGDGGRIDVDVNDLAVDRGKVLGVADHAVIEARAHGQQHVAVLHGVVGFQRAVHAQHAQKAPVGGRERTQAHQRVGDRVVQQIHQRAQLGRGIGQQHAAAGVDVGPLGRQQQLQRLANLPAMALAHRVVRAHFHLVGIAGVGGLVERHVLRDVHHHRAGAAGAGDVEGLFHDLGHVARVLDQEVVLDDGTRDAHRIAFLEGVQPDGRRGHLAGDDHHRD
jgi:hypothetical protein